MQLYNHMKVLLFEFMHQAVNFQRSHPSTGECWYHIPSPPRQTLRQLSVGRTSVFAVDENSE